MALEHVKFDEARLREWLADDEPEHGGASYAEDFAAGFVLNAERAFDLIHDAALQEGVVTDGRVPRVCRDAEEGFRPEYVSAVVEAAPGAWVSSADISLHELRAEAVDLVGADAYVALVGAIFGRINESIDAINAQA